VNEETNKQTDFYYLLEFQEKKRKTRTNEEGDGSEVMRRIAKRKAKKGQRDTSPERSNQRNYNAG
jgi:hypothetical protein